MKTKTRLMISILVTTALLFSSMAVAAAQRVIPASPKAIDRGKADNSPVITEADGNWFLAPPGLQKIVLIHYKRGLGKIGRPGKTSTQPKGYSLLGNGVKWRQLSVNYVVDPDNTNGLTEEFVTGAISKAAGEWDLHTGAQLFGSYTVDHNASWDNSAPDGRNELLFGNYPQSGVIGITVVWGYFSGPATTRKIIEFDTLFDTDYTWGDADSNNDGKIENPNVMDLQNIACHEMGHGAGLGDVYETVCAQETMYGYSTYGEIKKRDLNTGDIAGIQKLYGP